MARKESEVEKLIREIYQDCEDSDQEFCLATVILKAKRDKQVVKAVEEEVPYQIEQAVKRVDANRCKRPHNAQQKCFPGWDIDRVLALGEGRRIAKKVATLNHIREHLDILRENVNSVHGSYNAACDEEQKLRPHFVDVSTTFSEAVDSYREANPDQEAS